MDEPHRHPLRCSRGQERRREHRRLARARLRDRFASPAAATLLPDPLRRPRRRSLTRAGLALLVLVASGLTHAAILLLLAGAGRIMHGDARAGARDEKLQVTIIEPPPLAVEPPQPEPERPQKPEPPRATTKPKPKPKPAAPELPPDPVTPQPSPRTAEKQPVRRIVGLSLESTVSSGGGPAFSVGNTRMGRTERRAADPQQVDPLRTTNRVTRRLPTAPAHLQPPRRLARVAPVYPEELKALGLEADVVLSVTIGRDGLVTQVEVLKGAADPRFDAAAVAAARAERYQPATRDGEPVVEAITFTVRFRLTDS